MEEQKEQKQPEGAENVITETFEKIQEVAEKTFQNPENPDQAENPIKEQNDGNSSSILEKTSEEAATGNSSAGAPNAGEEDGKQEKSDISENSKSEIPSSENTSKADLPSSQDDNKQNSSENPTDVLGNPDGTIGIPEYEAGSIEEEIANIIAANHNYSFISCGRFLRNEVSKENLAKFYKEFRFECSSSATDTYLLKLLEEYLEIGKEENTEIVAD